MPTVKPRDDAPFCPKGCGNRLLRWSQYYGTCPKCHTVDLKPVVLESVKGGASRDEQVTATA